jgi:hypothetical protein
MSKFYGRKISKIGVNVVNATDNQLVFKEDYDTGTTTYYGANGKQVFQFGIFVDDSTYGQRIYDNNNNLVIQFGLLPTGDYGIAYFSSTGLLIKLDNGVTEYSFDASGINYCQKGLLPDGSYGEVFAKPGTTVASLFS